ncbi:MAG: hypothetical protein R3F48_07115 [Candidatus Zixiibacteriota bacterium]
MKRFPYEHRLQKEILFYPERPDDFSGYSLEIGPGRGDFLLSIAEMHPDKKFVAIEIGKKRYYKMIPRIEKKGLKNILLICGDSRIVINEMFGDARFERAYVLFPDPWPKRRHLPNRLLSIDFIRLVSSVISPGGHFFSATDYFPYAIWTTGNLQKVDDLTNSSDDFFTTMDRIDDYTPSFFEQKWRNEGRHIYYMRYRKSS